MGAAHEASQRSQNAPGDQDARQPDSRSKFVQQQIAGYLTDGIANKEDPSKESELLAGDGQLFVHGQRCKPNVDPIEKRHNVEQPDKGKNPDLQL